MMSSALPSLSRALFRPGAAVSILLPTSRTSAPVGDTLANHPAPSPRGGPPSGNCRRASRNRPPTHETSLALDLADAPPSGDRPGRRLPSGTVHAPRAQNATNPIPATLAIRHLNPAQSYASGHNSPAFFHLRNYLLLFADIVAWNLTLGNKGQKNSIAGKHKTYHGVYILRW